MNILHRINKFIINLMIHYIIYNAASYFHNISLYNISSSKNLHNFLNATTYIKNKEVISILFLSNKNNIIKYKILFNGTLDECKFYTRELIKEIFNLNAKSIIVCHNHTSGDTLPSHNDIQIAKKIQSILQNIDCDLLDFVITGKPDNFVSFKEKGYIN